MKKILASFFERDIRQLIEEISAFENEQNLWATQGSVKNPAGNLALHIIGGTNYLIGNKLAKTGYLRDRDKEFSEKGIDREILVAQLAELIPLVEKTLNEINLEDDYPIPFDDAVRPNAYVLTQLALHLNYHLGQVNYLRRVLE